jgi:phosphoribosyl 1,2-cyclic phosphodiesterase
MGIFQRKFGLPIHVTAQTYHSACRCNLGNMDDLRYFRSGETLQFGSVSVETIPTPHDGVDGVAFVVDDGFHRLGILTDLGHVFDGLEAILASLDAVLLESNYDPGMLANGFYPESLKRRIQGPGGHISNIESAHLLQSVAGRRLKWACLAHLSEDNNTPELAMKTHRRIVGKDLTIHVASRYEATKVLQVH